MAHGVAGTMVSYQMSNMPRQHCRPNGSGASRHICPANVSQCSS